MRVRCYVAAMQGRQPTISEIRRAIAIENLENGRVTISPQSTPFLEMIAKCATKAPTEPPQTQHPAQ
jgi:hypothetical protein